MKAFCVLAMSSLVGVALAGATNAVQTATVASATNAVATVAEGKADDRCVAITRSGKRCKRRKASGADCCRQHRLIRERKAK